MFSAVKNKAAGLINGKRARTSGGVWNLSRVNGQGLWLEQMVAHESLAYFCRLAEITPVLTPAQWSPPKIRACSIFTQRLMTE